MKSQLFPVWSTLNYFDLFSYPLKIEEIKNYIHFDQLSESEVALALDFLQNAGLVYESDGFYSLQKDKKLISRRKAGNERAAAKWRSANHWANFMRRFPFVRGVWISGSLSKDFMDEHSDIDYFIVTKPGRLWISRTLLVLFKKIFLLNSHRNFCVNYFIDEDHLLIPEQNLFIATELVTLKPLVNTRLFQRFIETNKWSDNFLPDYHPGLLKSVLPLPTSKIQRFTESLMSLLPLNKLNQFCMQVTTQFWNKKFNGVPEQVLHRQLRSELHVSKHHPQDYQNKVMRLYEEKIRKSPEWLQPEDRITAPSFLTKNQITSEGVLA